ncbi:MAG TPA: phosphoglycerate kinase [Candidatus Paceibacterota bacterium]|nr:phosphoglycerate kinase [Candidatus Paceibacterota bacterium]
MKPVRDIPVLENIPVMVRAALNEPVDNGVVRTTFRISRAVETLKHLADSHARVIAVSHIDPPGTTEVSTTAATLEPVAKKLGEYLKRVSFCPTSVGPEARQAIRNMSPGDILVLENLRQNAGEVKNDPAFARDLASQADVFVEDCFDTCHRVNASIVTVPTLLPSYIGFLAAREVEELTKARTPKSPSIAVISGAKFSTKQALLTQLLDAYDHVFVGGALANDFIRALGRPVGKSLVSTADAAQIAAIAQHPRLILPQDYLVALPGKTRAAARVATMDDVAPEEAILDVGPGTTQTLAGLIAPAQSILWNGPLGKYEDGFTESTEVLAKCITASRAHSVIGGGDTIAAIEKLNLNDRFSFISTGGGAMLDFLAKGTLPGIEALG